MMEKNHQPQKSRSFATNISDTDCSDQGGSHHSREVVDEDTSCDSQLPQLLEEVDRFLDSLSTAPEGEKDQPNPPPPDHPDQVPHSIEHLSDIVESMVSKYNAVKNSMRFGRDSEKDYAFLDALTRISRVSQKLGQFPSNSATASTLNRTSSILQKAMSFLDEEFRLLLDDTKAANRESDQKLQKPAKQSSFNNLNNLESDRCVLADRCNNNINNNNNESSDQDAEYPGFSLETVSNMNKIATAMILAGYETECCMAFSISRRTAFRSALDKLGYDHLSIDDIHKMSWESLEGEITTWIAVVRQCSSVLFAGERKLCDTIFSCDKSLSQGLFCNLARAVAIEILNFAEAVVLTKRAAEKLFKILDMYETLLDLIPAITESYPDREVSNELVSEATAVKTRLGEVALSIFCELENSIKNDNGRTPVASGAVHPLTRYVVNYLKYACELYKDTLEEAFDQHHGLKVAEKPEAAEPEADRDQRAWDKEDGASKMSPFQSQLMSVMELLDANIEMKSKLYRDPSLRCIFMMNNGRYILQKVKGSIEIHQLMGNTWCRKRSSGLRLYHKNYQRETWSKVLQCLNHEGLQVNGKVSKQVLKERFKTFNATFDEIHKTQSSWVVSDEQLQSELRVSVSAVMIPAYRSFLARFKQYLDSGRHAEKYIKYQPEDIETMIEDLFDGNATSMARRRS